MILVSDRTICRGKNLKVVFVMRSSQNGSAVHILKLERYRDLFSVCILVVVLFFDYYYYYYQYNTTLYNIIIITSV